jgi:RHS repeat-associated protein
MISQALKLVRWGAPVVAALLAHTAHSQGTAVSGPAIYDQTRTSSFTYYGAADGLKNGLLKSETIEPNKTQLSVVTTYDYNATGNKVSASTANLTGATGLAVFSARGSTTTFASQTVTVAGVSVTSPAGTFASSASNALGQTETRSFDPRFGAALSLTGPNALTTSWQLDNFGRQVKETRADGNVTLIAYCLISGRVTDTSSNSNSSAPILDPLTCPVPTALEIPGNAVSFVHSEPRASGGLVQNGPFTRVYSDKAGRKIRVVTQAFDGASQPGGNARLIVQDTDYNMYGAQIVATQPYFLNSGSSTSVGTGPYGMSRTDYDVLGRVVTSYTTDTSGSQLNVVFGTRAGSYQAARTSIAYGVLSSTVSNDLGQTRQEDKNLEGKVIRVTDHLLAQVAHQHDAFGNLVATKDALQNKLTIGYDERGRKVSMSDPDTGLWTYDYNALGELVWQQNANQRALAQVTTMAYDVLGRMVQRTEPEAISTWKYDRNVDASYCMAGTAPNRGAGKLCESNTSTGINRKFFYDNMGRPVNARTNVTNGPSFASAVGIDANGRLISQSYPSGLKVNYNYTTLGFPSSLTLATAATGVALPAGSALWTALAYNAWGKAEQHSYGNGVVNRASFDAMTGRLTAATAGVGAATNVLSQHYTWDSLAHLVARIDDNGDGNTGAVSDAYSYDGIGRLQAYSVSAPTIPGLSRTVTLQYNAAGMTLYKSDVGVYSYGAQNTAGVKPHALQSVAGAFNASYLYDANGNLTNASAGKYSTIAYTSFNLPDNNISNIPTPGGVQGPAGGPGYAWLYDENHQRIKETRVTGSGASTTTRTTWSLHPDNQGGLGFECDSNTNTSCASADTSNRHYLSVGGISIGVLLSNGPLPVLGASQMAPTDLATIALVKVEYWHKDHLGSLISSTDHSGAVTARYAYDPFGKRRLSNGVYDAFGTLVVDWVSNTPSGTDRGYTGHEQLDDIGLIHMNARLYDPLLGRFLQGDAFIQDPTNLQNFNRYAYCYNNPLTCTDPSGQLFGIDDWIIATIIATVWATGVIDTRTAISLLASLALPGSDLLFGLVGNGAVAQAAVTGFVSGSISSGNLEGGLQGAFTAGTFAGVGNVINGTDILSGAAHAAPGAGAINDAFTKVALHAVAGCVTSAAGGGKCGADALAAGFSELATVNGLQAKGPTGAITSAMIGGTASVLGGGKFANGAVTAAAGYLFNELLHSGPGAMQRAGYKETAYADGTYCNIQGSPACGYPGASAGEGSPLTVQLGVGGQAGAGLIGVAGEVGIAVPTNLSDVCVYAQACFIAGPQYVLSGSGALSLGQGTPNTGVQGSRGFTWFGGTGAFGSVQMTGNADGQVQGTRGVVRGGVGTGGGAGYVECGQATACIRR